MCVSFWSVKSIISISLNQLKIVLNSKPIIKWNNCFMAPMAVIVFTIQSIITIVVFFDWNIQSNCKLKLKFASYSKIDWIDFGYCRPGWYFIQNLNDSRSIFVALFITYVQPQTHILIETDMLCELAEKKKKSDVHRKTTKMQDTQLQYKHLFIYISMEIS